MSITGRQTVLFFICSVTLVVLSSVAFSASAPQKHPIEVESGQCSSCHTDKKYGIEHTPGWYSEHRFRASQEEALCVMCHVQSFCADCHAGKEEQKPGDKVTEEPGRNMPHRGDYMTRHKIDVKIDPATCFRCHGRGNNTKCKVCHR